MRSRLATLAAILALGCAAGAEVAEVEDPEEVRRLIFEANDAMVASMMEGRSTNALETAEWEGVNLNGTPMSASGFEGEERTVEYDRIDVLDRDVRVYGDVAALRWHANFHVKVNGQPSFAEMRLLDVYVRRNGDWLVDLTQVTPVYGTVGNPPDGVAHPPEG